MPERRLSPLPNLRAAIVLACATAVPACAPEAPVSPPGDPTIAVGDITPKQLEALYQRRIQPVANVTIEATLWDPNLIALWGTTDDTAVGDGSIESDQSVKLHDRRSEWTARYV
ncbi:MAG: hypothetical protein ACPHRO_15035, partial [Nannocystaceae bacterium]